MTALAALAMLPLLLLIGAHYVLIIHLGLSPVTLLLTTLLLPLTISCAGLYDRWPWLSFAPFAVPLAMGPLL